MRFQTTQTVPTSDTERVLHALEVSLRELSNELERKGPRITLYGLGPSPRARNYRDTAVFDVSTDNGSTTIGVDVTFQASALLGASGQVEVVGSKLDYAFDQMRMQLGVPEAGRCQEAGLPAAVLEPQQVSEAELSFEQGSPHIADAEQESSRWSPDSPAASDEIASYAWGEPDDLNSAALGNDFGKPQFEPLEAEREVTPFSVWAASLRSVQVPRQPSDSGVEPSAEMEEHEAEAPILERATEAHKTNLPIVLAILLGTAVAAGSVYLYWAGLLHRMQLGFVHPKAAAPAPQPAPPAVQATAPAPVIAEPAPPVPPRHEEADPKVWLEQWAEAMRGRDPVLQASFYADPIVRYLDDTNVSREALTTFFRSQIQARNDVWTMKLERVSIEPLTSSHVIARVSKHFMELENSAQSATDAIQTGAAGSQITDRYARSRLELRRTNGEWKIVSEQDVTPATSAR